MRNPITIQGDSRYGFRSQRSCETQLLQFVNDLLSNYYKAINKRHRQTGVIVMDFAKAFDKVPHRSLIYNLEYYGIRGLTNMWVAVFISDRTKHGVLDRVTSNPAHILSLVTHGSVLGHVLFSYCI